LYLCLIGFVAHLAGNKLMLDANSQLLEAQQMRGDLHPAQLLYSMGRAASSIGFLAASLGFLWFAVYMRRRMMSV
jgi:hypothetical protein